MLFPNIWEVRLHGVFDRNLANRERVVLQAEQSTDMSQFFLLVGVPTGENSIFPLPDLQFWFGGIALGPGDWIVLFTGSGEPRQERDESGRMVHILFWGRSHTLFTGSYVPALIRAGGIIIGDSQQAALPAQAQATATTSPALSPTSTRIAFTPAPRGYRAIFAGKSLDVTRSAGEAGQFSSIYLNEGTEPWEPGKVFLAVAAPADAQGWSGQRLWAHGWFSERYYATVSAVVRPGQNGFFIFNFMVPQNAAPGVYPFYARVEAGNGRVISDTDIVQSVHVTSPQARPS